MTAATETTHCLRCGRVLRSLDSVKRGMGRTCRAKVTAAEAAADLADFKPEQIAHANELIEDGAIVQLRPRIYRSVSTDGSELYLTAATGQCNCPAGLKNRRCYHVAAVRILDLAA
jgi:hypothetical protein